jgi:phosphoadenosine phosphosulfate reductase
MPHRDNCAYIAALNQTTLAASAADVISVARQKIATERLALVSSFGADAVVLLHLLAQADTKLPVLFIDTELLFEESLTYQRRITAVLGLENVQVIRTNPKYLRTHDPDNTLHQRDADHCYHIRKTGLLDCALTPYEGWISGRKRFQGKSRAKLDHFECDTRTQKIKISPLAHWSEDRLRQYMSTCNLPRHPLVAKGYPSIRCAPCTTSVAVGDDPRAGRWPGQDKTECGLHTARNTIPIQRLSL